MSVSIAQGTYRARPAHEAVLAFLGVPYARQPVGEWRWREAEPPATSTLTVDADAFGPTAHQPRDENERASFQPQGEDCLSLNIWTRGPRPDGRPVMVFIHGGANVSGGSADPLYDGHNVVRDNDVVLVTINYRLGPFGFLDLSEVGGPAYARSRNLGLLDQLAALRWVRANIAAFGGDAGNITVFGESAGGSAIMRLLGMPLARGLFDKAIIESGGPANIRVKGYPKADDVPAGRALTREMMQEAGVTDLAGLMALPAESVMAAAAAVARRRGDTMGISTWGARVDEVVLPDDLFGNIRRGANPGVKVLIGTNEDEMLYFRLYDRDFERGLMREYHATATSMGRPFGKVKALADRYIGGSSDPMRYVDFAGEFWLRQPSILLAEGQSHHNDVFMYLWTWDSQVPGLGAAHAIELPFVFGNLRDQSAVALTGANPPAELSRRIQAAWTAFALTGTPTAGGETPWPRYTPASRATMILTDGPWRVVDDPRGDDRQILREMFDVDTR
ncbi:carboxylesterase family protein [Luteitalea sp.]|uniref:carboxylesterase/lipase family protein n=1 Tax=Luteitalea sp. TaxID=2004800 RepID=UPI0025BE1AD7|nr:carboxylesterase family protein [Luteitalea sp.]